MEHEVRVRFAPSPTGYLHIGGARTAIFNYLFSKKRDGKFILRIEDTDAERSTKESIQGIIESLKWIGITWDEGPYFQSQFVQDHQEAAQSLLESGHAYKCFCTKEDLNQKREEALRKKTALQYDGTCRNLTPDEIATKEAAGIPHTIRLRVPGGEGFVRFSDIRKDDPKFFTDPKAISINAHYLRNLPVEEIEPYVKEQLEREGVWDPEFHGKKRDRFLRTVDLIRGRYHVTTDFVTIGRAYFSDDYPIDPKALKKNVLKHKGLEQWFPILADRLKAIKSFTVEETEQVIREMAEEFGIKAGILINGVRTVVTGQAVGPGLFDVLVTVGQRRVVDRLRKAGAFFG